MGFRNGAYATVWEVESISNNVTKLRVSISKKSEDKGYITDFSGIVRCLGSAVSQQALALKKGDRIKLGEVDVSTSYNKETKREYISYKVFSFESVSSNYKKNEDTVSKDDPEPVEGDLDIDDEPLPF